MSDLLRPLFEAFAPLYDQSRMATWGGPDMPSRVDSWLERRFAWHAIKYLRPDIKLRPQVEFLTPGGKFRVDFLTENFRVPLAFECDGAASHARTRGRDHIRDSWLLTSTDLWGIYRLPYRDLVEWPEWCFLTIAKRHYELFTDAALVNLNTLTQQSGDAPEHLGMSYRCKP